MKKILYFCFAFLAFGFQASAAEYSVTPLIIEHTIEPRDMIEETIKITNNSGKYLRIFATVNAITLGEDGEIVEFVSASMSDKTTSVTSWISVNRGRIEVGPGESIKVPINIAVNPNTPAGDYYAFIGFAEGSKRDDAEAKVRAGAAPGVVVSLLLEDKRTEYLRLNKFVVNQYVTAIGKSEILYELENAGDTDVIPKGEIIFYNLNGQEVGTIAVNPEAKVINPGSKEYFTALIPDTGKIGKHKAFLNIDYGVQQRASVYDTAYFTVIPLKLLIILFIVLLVLSVSLTLWHYNRRHHLYSDIDDETVAVYVQSGVSSIAKDHDINLKNNK